MLLLSFVSPGTPCHGSQEHWLLEEGSSRATFFLKQLHGMRHLGTNCKFLFVLHQIGQKSPFFKIPCLCCLRLHCPSVTMDFSRLFLTMYINSFPGYIPKKKIYSSIILVKNNKVTQCSGLNLS